MSWTYQYWNDFFCKKTELPPQQHQQNLANRQNQYLRSNASTVPAPVTATEPEEEQEIDVGVQESDDNEMPKTVRFQEPEGHQGDEEDRDVPQTSQNLALAGVPAKSVKMQSTSTFIDIEWVPVLPILCAKTSIVATRTAQQCQQEQGSAKSD